MTATAHTINTAAVQLVNPKVNSRSGDGKECPNNGQETPFGCCGALRSWGGPFADEASLGPPAPPGPWLRRSKHQPGQQRRSSLGVVHADAQDDVGRGGSRTAQFSGPVGELPHGWTFPLDTNFNSHLGLTSHALLYATAPAISLVGRRWRRGPPLRTNGLPMIASASQRSSALCEQQPSSFGSPAPSPRTHL